MQYLDEWLNDFHQLCSDNDFPKTDIHAPVTYQKKSNQISFHALMVGHTVQRRWLVLLHEIFALPSTSNLQSSNFNYFILKMLLPLLPSSILNI